MSIVINLLLRKKIINLLKSLFIYLLFNSLFGSAIETENIGLNICNTIILFFFFFENGSDMELYHNKELYRKTASKARKKHKLHHVSLNKRSYTGRRDSKPKVLSSKSSSKLKEFMSNSVKVSA